MFPVRLVTVSLLDGIRENTLKFGSALEANSMQLINGILCLLITKAPYKEQPWPSTVVQYYASSSLVAFSS